MIYQIFSIVLSALFLMCVFWALWYIAIPLLALMMVISVVHVFFTRIKNKMGKYHAHSRPIRANDVIDVDFKEIK